MISSKSDKEVHSRKIAIDIRCVTAIQDSAVVFFELGEKWTGSVRRPLI